MSDLLAELAGSEFASQYDVNVTACKVKKEDMSMSVDVESDAFPCVLPFAKLRAAIRERYGVSKISFNLKYIGFDLTSENKNAFYENVREYVCFIKPDMAKIFVGSSLDFADNVLKISIRFGNEETLKKEHIDTLIKNYVKRSFLIDVDVEFLLKEKEEDKLLEEIEETKVLGDLEAFLEEDEQPPVEEDFTAYAKLSSDVDLEEYSEEVYRGKKDPIGGLAIFFLVVTTLLFCFLLYIYLHYKGVL